MRTVRFRGRLSDIEQLGSFVYVEGVTDPSSERRRPHVVIVGGGFGGMNAAQKLRRAPVDVTLIDRRNHHLFQPLLYEVATAALSPGEIAIPLRAVFRNQKNCRVVLGEVTGVDLENRRLSVCEERIDYDYLVLATGAVYHYFGNDSWEERAPGLKSVDDAVEIRRGFLLGFERAESTDDAEERRRLMTTVIVGGGPTGIELAGTMAEVARHVLRDDFRRLDPTSFRIVLAEGADRLLLPFPEELSARAKLDLERLGVDVRLSTRVTDIDGDGVTLEDGTRISAYNVVWAAGVKGAAPGGGAGLGDAVRKDGKIAVQSDLSLPGHPEVFAIGDLAHVPQGPDATPAPALAPAAIQMGSYVGKLLRQETQARSGTAGKRKPFVYRDKGTMATIGRGKAVAAIGRFRFGGFLAWVTWVLIHIMFLVGFRNKLMVMIEWAYAYITFHRGARLITGEVPRGPGTAEG